MKLIKKIHSFPIQIFDNGVKTAVSDFVVLEQPLEIRLAYGNPKNRTTESIYVTMRTPGDDVKLALGFLYTESIIQSLDQVYKIDSLNENVILVELLPEIHFDKDQNKRNFLSNSSCGICGKTSISSIVNYRYDKIKIPNQKISTNTILSILGKIKDKQSVFNQTGGLHSASLFDLEGNLITIHEDIGRHNALDKLIGYMLEKEIDEPHNYILLLSGRIGFELIHKTLRIGIGIIVAIGSPSSLSVEMAQKNKLCLIGFLKSTKFNIYSSCERVVVFDET